MRRSRKLGVAGLVLALSLGATGCVTTTACDSIKHAQPEEARPILYAAAVPFTVACDLALSPLYVVGVPVLFLLLLSALPRRA